MDHQPQPHTRPSLPPISSLLNSVREHSERSNVDHSSPEDRRRRRSAGSPGQESTSPERHSISRSPYVRSRQSPERPLASIIDLKRPSNASSGASKVDFTPKLETHHSQDTAYSSVPDSTSYPPVPDSNHERGYSDVWDASDRERYIKWHRQPTATTTIQLSTTHTTKRSVDGASIGSDLATSPLLPSYKPTIVSPDPGTVHLSDL
ncbi:uncharacterized protein AB675_9243 [Cyphellophora attinorum]|uniref:Uncharacterized protein n=1 Tax=Cyphellophora attinorum TaxID=1664694 RepID=A0A0N0NNL4_9EURO|nr:uncharacterized protein AB675_9243 [Phialophora attinorum]KPI41741.1 hypothetical protein AB675_9243 [Phialophora attinorum]